MAAKRDAPLAALAQIHALFHGYADAAGRVASTATFIRDSDVRVIEDPGMAPTPAAILDPLDRHTRPNAAGHHDARRRRVWYRRVRASVMACAGSHRRPAGLRSGGAACGRTRVLQLASLIVPAHGVPFIPAASTPR
jgi:hypothetical protein